MKLSVLMPVFNEEATIAEIIARVRASDAGCEKEIIVVDDCSTDGTPGILLTLGGADIIRIRHERNRGKGAAVRTALAAATGDVVLIQDADLEYDPGDYGTLMRPFLIENARVVYGSRLLRPIERYSSLSFYLGGRFLTLLTNLLFGLSLTDEATGYKAFRRDIISALPLRGDGFEFCPEVTACIARRGIPIVEVPIRYFPRSFAQGKKITAWDGLTAIITLIRLRFSARADP